MLFTDEMFNTQGESTTLADMNAGSGSTTGPYSPKVNCKIIKVILLWAGEAVTSLFENARVELTCTNWTPNLIKVGIVGANIRTAPAMPIPPADWPIDQPCQTQLSIGGQYIYADAATPITCNLRVFGLFQPV